MSKTKKKIEKSKPRYKALSHFLEYFKNLEIVSPEKINIFEVIDHLIKEIPLVPFEFYLCEIISLFRNTEKSFFEMRSKGFYEWLLKTLAILEEKKRINGRRESCQIFPKIHSVSFPFRSKEVLGLLVRLEGDNRLYFCTSEVKKAILENRKGIFYVEGSSFHIVHSFHKTSTIYLEVQKNEESFTQEEIIFFSNKMPEIISKKIENSQKYLILPSNRELLAKSYNWISNEIRPGDLPHVCIDFSRKEREIYQFTAVICRFRQKTEKALKECITHRHIQIEGIIEIEEDVFFKEGITLTIETSENFLSTPIDARKEISNLIESLIGPFRDVNGGILEKAEENLERFSEEIKLPREDLKGFFYKISPQENQAIAPISLLKALYLALEKHKKTNREIDFEIEEKESLLCVTLKVPHPSFEKEFKTSFVKQFPSALIAAITNETSSIVSCAFGNIEEDECEKIKKFISLLYKNWIEKKEVKQVLRICSENPFSSFDPRIGIDDGAIYLHKMLFEGLMRVNKNGVIENAVAEKVEISRTGLCYRFFLKKSYWSNGMPLTAHDFAYSWKMSLHPEFKSPMDYLFFCIENARKIKECRLDIEKIGINVMDDYVLEVKLCHPVPYFLELCTHTAFSPICKAIDVQNPSWPKAVGSNYVCNGPFKLERVNSHEKVILVKNPYYRESNQVILEKVSIDICDQKKCIELFLNDQVDGLLNPFYRRRSPLKIDNRNVNLLSGNDEITYLHMNCSKRPFNNKKIRQAISLSLNREMIVERLSSKSFPYFGMYSPRFSKLDIKMNREENPLLAQRLFLEGLEELGIERKKLQEERLFTTPINKQLGKFIIQQINSTLTLNWKLVEEEPLKLFSLLRKGKILFSICKWVDRILDPNYFLETFTKSDQIINMSFWTNKKLQKIIEEIKESFSIERRRFLHIEAEKILLKEKPIIPLFFTVPYSVFHENIFQIYSNELEEWNIRHSFKTHNFLRECTTDEIFI